MDTRQNLAVVASAMAQQPRDAVRRARTAGFGGLLFDAQSPALNFADLSASGRREFSHLLAAERQRLVGLRIELDGKGLTPGTDIERAVERMGHTLEAAAHLAAGCVCVDLGLLPAARESSPRDPAFVSLVRETLVEIGRRADRYSVIVAMSASLSDFAALDDALSAAACPWFGVDFDPVAALTDAWDLDRIFSNLGSMIRHVRARDAVLGHDRRTRSAVVGTGSVDWPALLSALDDTGYTGPITLDPADLPDRFAAAVAGRDFLTKLGSPPK